VTPILDLLSLPPKGKPPGYFAYVLSCSGSGATSIFSPDRGREFCGDRNARTVSIYENSEAGVRRASTSMKLTLQVHASGFKAASSGSPSDQAAVGDCVVAKREPETP
jgi:hypothetical protein